MRWINHIFIGLLFAEAAFIGKGRIDVLFDKGRHVDLDNAEEGFGWTYFIIKGIKSIVQ